MSEANTKHTMLVVDDNKLNREILSSIFLDTFYVIKAESGQEALDILKENAGEIDIVLLDLVMPGLSGHEVLQLRSKLDYFKNVPVIVITASDSNDDQVKAFSLGASDYITKPFISEIVRTRVEYVMMSRSRFLAIEQEAERMKIKAETDEMTKLYNKSASERLINEILAGDDAENCAMLIIDIDNFKAVNDLLGHQVGDHTIQIVADVISSVFCENDIVGRVGGDEFVVLVTDVPSMEFVKEKSVRLIDIIEKKLNLTIPDFISLSIGYAGVRKNDNGYQDVFHRADEALYQAKKNGKSQALEYGSLLCQEKEDEVSVLLLSKNRNISSEFKAIMFRGVNVELCGDMEELETLPKKNISIAYIDVSEVTENHMDYWKEIYTISGLKNVPLVAICKEGSLVQYKAAINVGVMDILTVPLENAQCKRRMACHLRTINEN